MQAETLLHRFSHLPKWPYGFRLLFILGMSFFFAFFDTVTIAVALPRIQSVYHIGMAMASWSVTSSLMGYVAGALLLAWVSDRYGRKLPLCLAVVLFSAGSLLTAVADSFTGIVIFRFVTGMGIGADIAAVTCYLSEVSPAYCRGRNIAVAVLFGMTGVALVPFIALYFVPNFSWGYRAMFVLGGVGAGIIALMRYWVPESLAWLVTHGYIDQAQAQLKGIEARLGLKEGWVDQLKASLKANTKALTRSQVIRRGLLFVCIWFFYYICNYSWLTLVPDLFMKHGLALAKSLEFVAIDSIGLVLGVVVVLIIGDRIERKWVAMANAGVWVCVVLWIGWFPSGISLTVGGLIAAMTIGVMIPTLYTYTAEHFPTQVRTTGLAFGDSIGHIGGAFCGQIVFTFGVFFNNHFAGYFTVMAISGLVVGILLMFGSRMTDQSVVG